MKVFLETIGCRLNQSEIEGYARQFRAAGHTLVDNAEEADLVVVNTCAVTREAASDSRQKIRQAARVSHAQVIVTGCWSSIDPDAAAGLPNVIKVVPNLEKDHLVSSVLQIPAELFDLEPLARMPLPGTHARTRAFIKVQDGCDNHCTFCVTRIARGPGRSRKTDAVIADIQAAVDGGTREAVLSGVHLGSWGQDFSTPQHLRQLIEAILLRTNVERLRLSSLEPWDLDAAFFQLWSDPRLCRHLHLPLQSGSAATLHRMARKTTPASFARLLEDARSAASDLAVTTDVISGFPGETEQEFAESIAFIEEMKFAGGHVFTYSPRPDTAAMKLPNPVPKSIGKVRNAMLRRVFAEAERSYAEQFVGKELSVLWESSIPLDSGQWQLGGLTGNYLRVVSQACQNLWNQLSDVRIEANTAAGLSGSILSD